MFYDHFCAHCRLNGPRKTLYLKSPIINNELIKSHTHTEREREREREREGDVTEILLLKENILSNMMY